MKVRELLQEISMWDESLEVFIPNADPLGEPLPAHEWEYVYESEDFEGRGKPIGIIIEAHPWWRVSR